MGATCRRQPTGTRTPVSSSSPLGPSNEFVFLKRMSQSVSGSRLISRNDVPEFRPFPVFQHGIDSGAKENEVRYDSEAVRFGAAPQCLGIT